MKYLKLYENFENDNIMVFYHGGNLDNADDYIIHKKGKITFGTGLYGTERLDIARKYAKGGRKLYKLEIEKGNDITKCFLDKDKCMNFINNYIIKSLRLFILGKLEVHFKNDKIDASIFNNLILNFKGIKSSNTPKLRKFFVDNNIDYEISNNTFGFSEKMIVLFNMKKIKNIYRMMANDELKLIL